MKFSAGVIVFTLAAIQLASAAPSESAENGIAMQEHKQASAKYAYQPGGKGRDPCAQAAKHLVNFYRSWNAAATDHLYTTNEQEWNRAAGDGWAKEGPAARIFNIQVPNSVPLYRMYSPARRDHLYTTNRGERQNAINALGYHDEGIAGYVYPRPVCGARPFYRMFQAAHRTGHVYAPNRIYGDVIPTGDHFYTVDANERANAINKLQYGDEGIAAYVI